MLSALDIPPDLRNRLKGGITINRFQPNDHPCIVGQNNCTAYR